MAEKTRASLPGFRLSLGFALLYMSLLVLIPLAGCAVKASTLSWSEFWATVTHPRALAAFRVSFSTSFLAALFISIFGLMVTWVLVRYEFPGKKILDALVDLPLALPTAVAGIAFASLYAPNIAVDNGPPIPGGWFGQYLGFLEPDGWLGHWFGPDGWFGSNITTLDVRAHSGPFAIVIVLMFVGVPFVIRSVQPVLAELEAEQEEAAASLGASRWQTFRYVILPALLPAFLTGFALAYARGLGEYGSIIFVSSLERYKTEIPPILIIEKLENFKYEEAAAIALVLLTFSLATLLLINILERWSRTYKPG